MRRLRVMTSRTPSADSMSLAAVLFPFPCFFFQAEDGIRDHCVTGVQTCALPISSTAARRSRNPVTIRSAAHVGRNVASTAEIAANRKPRKKRPKTAAPTPMPIPTPRTATFFFSSSPASSSSSFAIVLACSATVFAATPTPPLPSALASSSRCSEAGVGMAPPVDDPRERDAERDRGSDNDPRARPAGARRLGACPELRSRRRDATLGRLLVRRQLASRARLDEARLELAQELGVVGERLRELRLHAALQREPVGLLLELVRCGVEAAHFLVGGSSPVAIRQIRDESRRAATVATAPKSA